MNMLMDPIFAAGFHPLCPYHYFKYGIMLFAALWAVFAALGIENKYAKGAITAAAIAILSAPYLFPLMKDQFTEPTQKTETTVVENTATPPQEATNTAVANTQNLLFALFTDEAAQRSYCYILNTKHPKFAIIIEAPRELAWVQTLQLHWNAELETIFALTSGPITELYQIDLKTSSFEFLTSLEASAPIDCSAFEGDQLIVKEAEAKTWGLDLRTLERYEINPKNTETVFYCLDKGNASADLEETLPEHWTLTSWHTTHRPTGETFFSVFDTKQEIYQIVLQSEDGLHQPLIETVLPVHALAPITVTPQE